MKMGARRLDFVKPCDFQEIVEMFKTWDGRFTASSTINVCILDIAKRYIRK